MEDKDLVSKWVQDVESLINLMPAYQKRGRGRQKSVGTISTICGRNNRTVTGVSFPHCLRRSDL
jgi:hypothetical protein